MADFYITEYAKLGTDANGKFVLAGFEPNVAEQQISNPATSTQSAALNPLTCFVMIHATAVGHILFGANPTAVITKGRIGAGETRFYGVQPGQSIKIAAINGT
ncbi:hypothetical protein [Mesorhizobium sp. B2-1-2]|uniref:hypothetical protein n=1 Tax=Mesorhizobium sp. B2-1-2 TaxID=2589973 RepID=UPI00112AB99B|nr:hypothetical protein [Mesorhizobium sp. B2-1-2]TPN11710.1 hypothetical protein FJ971_09900 [Mesorhizobium sp. B2-1-2]